MILIRSLYKHGVDGNKHKEIQLLDNQGEVHKVHVVNTTYGMLYSKGHLLT